MAFVQEQLIEVVRQKQVFEEAVQKSLANVGLSLLMVNGDFDLKMLDYKKLRRMVGFNNDPVAINSVGKSEKAGDLEEANALLQQTLLSLKYHSENQRNELSRKTELLQKKSEECLNLKTEIKSMYVPISLTYFWMAKSLFLSFDRNFMKRKQIFVLVNNCLTLATFIVVNFLIKLRIFST